MTAAGNQDQAAGAQQLALIRDWLAESRHAEAIQSLDALLEREPGWHEALYLRGTARLELEQPREALPDLQQALALAPADERYLYNAAVAHWLLGDVDQAVQHCNRALETNAGFSKALGMLERLFLHGENYFSVLARIHGALQPRTYLEIGVSRGESIRLVRPDTVALGVDPEPELHDPLPPNVKIFRETSDEFFARRDLRAELQGLPVDLAFIDGLHHFEVALRDFLNVERHCAPDSTILIHDCFPRDRVSAQRARAAVFWTGDIWRLVLLLKKYRPDLSINTIAAPYSGLGVVRKLDPRARFGEDQLESACEEFAALDYSFLDEDRAGKLNLVPNDWEKIRRLLGVAG